METISSKYANNSRLVGPCEGGGTAKGQGRGREGGLLAEMKRREKRGGLGRIVD
jgi:hypothetical protein